jgi:hypothetical protein
MIWNSVDTGQGLGQTGSDGGTIIRDEIHDYGARVTLEQDSLIAPFAITCGIYGWMVHTCFFDTESVAQQAFERIKTELSSLLELIPLTTDPDIVTKAQVVTESIAKFVESYQ